MQSLDPRTDLSRNLGQLRRFFPSWVVQFTAGKCKKQSLAVYAVISVTWREEDAHQSASNYTMESTVSVVIMDKNVIVMQM